VLCDARKDGQRAKLEYAAAEALAPRAETAANH